MLFRSSLSTVASAVDKDAPVVEQAMTRLRRARKGAADMERAEAVVAEFEGTRRA